jgi:hypothetical protein
MKKMSRVLALAAVLLLAGCTKETVEGEQTIFAYEWWVSVVAILAGLGGTGLCLLAKDWRGYLGAVIFAAMTVGLGPMSLVDYVKVDSKSVKTRWGFWMFPTVHDVSLADVSSVDLTKRTSGGRRRRTNYYMVFKKKNGSTDELSLSNSLMEAAAEKIGETLALNDIEVNDLTGG